MLQTSISLSHQRIWLLAYALVAVPELIGEMLDARLLVYCTKPLLMPVLLLGFLVITRNHRSFWQWAVAGALVASTLGDVLLMFSGPLFFLAGLAAFFFAQAHYISAFGSRAGWHRGYLSKHPWLILPVAAYLFGLLRFLWPTVAAGMQIPVVVYALALSTMLLAVINLRDCVAHSAWQRLMWGVVLFLVSDSLLAINKFALPFEGSRVAIMLTYIVAQWFLAQGAAQTLFFSGPTRQKWRPGRQTT